MDRYVIMFCNGLYYHDVQSSSSKVVKTTDNVKNAHTFDGYKSAEQAVLYWGMHNDLTFNIVAVGE
jgi:hypothetical protein